MKKNWYCADCGKKISHYHTRCIGCSKRGERNKNWRGGLKEKQCLTCGKTLFLPPYRIEKSKLHFCSPKCWGTWKSINIKGETHPLYKRKECLCKNCGKSFQVKPSRIKRGGGKFCSKKCMGEGYSKNNVGSNNGHWKGGISEAYQKHRTERGWKKWSAKIFKRDDYACQLCLKRGGHLKLHAHHIVPWYQSHDDRLKNLITLCQPCHARVEKKWQKYAPYFFEKLGLFNPKEDENLFNRKGG